MAIFMVSGNRALKAAAVAAAHVAHPSRPAGADMMLRRRAPWCLFNRLLRSAAIGAGLIRRRFRAMPAGALLCRIKQVFPDSTAYPTRFTQLLLQSE
ncbi:hypothetical protein [Burkholderia sp. IDO3]|uniref:hypothetical protein n=1 Tax=Burkholderia sp. IDO3 TaxID=1705310 RepID=UPI001177460D|nr:hypothetical protein [Burkholderia sp. IDO3]